MKTFYDSKNNQVNLMELNDIESSDGYIKFPEGTLICYGKYDIDNNYITTISFPYEFIDIEYSMAIIQDWFSIAQTYVSNDKTKQSCKIIFFNKDLQGSEGSYHGRYIAIGKWK